MILGTGVIGGAVFPTVMGQATSSDNTVGSSMSVGLPTGIVAGELLLVIAAFRSSSSISGWTTAVSSSLLNVFWKIATGSEGSSVTLSTSGGTTNGASIAYRIKGGKSLEMSSVSSGTSSSPNPLSLSPSWGNKKTLWFAGMAAGGTSSNISVSGYPTGFTNPRTAQGVTSFPSARRVAAAEKQEKAASQDPSSFSISSISWAACTIGIKP